ncbi:hypothetical protein A1Q2_02107 [Trichosporon asahii var. asahii CBS 8904]|uniref:Uncharacterized protein n=1 Tax=Trichosporon asahii var. asahii (strain CBS 8904) TaxID=1220162 RepID=K1WR61_TRIAC|nr:hypothetical protein A1Q2_02107 [Trichosporon asahii var. asahii CBS 8904]
MASQSQVSAPSTTTSPPSAPSSTPGITRESFLQRARAAALRDKGGSKSPASSRAQSPAGSRSSTAQQVTQPEDAVSQNGQAARAFPALESAPRLDTITQSAPSWSVDRALDSVERTQPAPASSPTTEVLEMDELQDSKADQRHSSPDSVEFIQETAPTQQRRRPPLVSSSAPAPSSSTVQPAAGPAPPTLDNLAEDSPSAAVEDQLELSVPDVPVTNVAEPEVPENTTTAEAIASLPTAGSSDPSQPALVGDPSPLLPLIQSFPPDSRRVAIRSFEALPEDIKRKVLGSKAMMDNFKAYVLTNVVPAQQQTTAASTTTTSQPSAVNAQPIPNESADLAQQQSQAQQVQRAQLAQQQAWPAVPAADITNIGEQPSTNSGNTVPTLQQTQSPQLHDPHSSAYVAQQQQSPVVPQVVQQVQSPTTAFQESPGVSIASTLQSQSPVIVQAAPQHYGPAVPPSVVPSVQAPLHRVGQGTTTAPATVPNSAVSSALVSVGGMENRLGAWTQGLFQDVRQNLVAPLEAALREAERQRDQWKSVAENNSAALSQLLGQQANQQWQARLTAVSNQLIKAREERDRFKELYQTSIVNFNSRTSQLQSAQTAYQDLERRFNENRKHTLTIMNGFETLKRQNDELNRQKQVWMQSSNAAAQQQQIQQLQQENNALMSESSNKDAKVAELEKRVKELQHDRETAIKVMKTEAEKWRETAEKNAALEELARQADSRSAALEIKLRGVEMHAQAKIAELEGRLKADRPPAPADNGAEARVAELERRLQQAERMAQADKEHAESKAQAERRAQLRAIELEKQLKESESEVQDYKQQFESLRTTAQAKIDQQHATITKLRERNQRYKEVARQSIGGASPALKRPADSQASPSQQSQRFRQ